MISFGHHSFDDEDGMFYHTETELWVTPVRRANREHVKEGNDEQSKMAFGKPGNFHFDESEEQFDGYLERLKQYFEANDLKDMVRKRKRYF